VWAPLISSPPPPQPAGRCWYYHDRGFLCDGKVFVDDEAPPFVWVSEGGGAESCRIGVHWDCIAGELPNLLLL
jgi:hypothetical protein